jgi:hypothetical protein
MNIKDYTQKNGTFNKTLIFHIGCGAGFFSEYNNMVFAIAYCLVHKINFKLYSQDANFSYHNGWGDFFEPFCDEVTDRFHSRLNRRQTLPSLKIIIRVILRKILLNKPMDRFQWYMVKQYFQQPYYKRVYHFDYYTSDLWREFTKFSPYFNDQIDHDIVAIDSCSVILHDLLQEVLTLTWQYTPTVKTKIQGIIQQLNLPQAYYGMHIRAGDKITEDEVFPYKQYFDLLHQKKPDNSCYNIFILTDDYRIIEDVRKSYPEYFIFTLCQPSERGYIHSNFSTQTLPEKNAQLLNLFASIDILSQSKMFIGVINSNPGIYLKVRMDSKCTFFVDRK